MKPIILVMLSVFAVVAAIPKSNSIQNSVLACGVPKLSLGLVVRGRNFSRGDFPWMVALTYTNTQPPSFFCGGIIISTTYVLTGKKTIWKQMIIELSSFTLP